MREGSAVSKEPLLVKITYTRGKDKGIELYLPVYPTTGASWREGIAA